MQPHKVIIEETQETDSETDSNSLADSFEGKDLAKLLDDFIGKAKKNKQTPVKSAICRTPTSYGEHSRPRMTR